MKLVVVTLTAVMVMALAGTAVGQSDGSTTLSSTTGGWQVVNKAVSILEALKGVSQFFRPSCDCDVPRDSRAYCHFLLDHEHVGTVRVLIWDVGSEKQCEDAIKECAGGRAQWDDDYPKKRPNESYLRICERS